MTSTEYIVDEETTVAATVTGWLAGLMGLLLAIIAWARDYTRRRQDLNAELGDKLLKRVDDLEKRENTYEERENKLRERVRLVEEESENCRFQYAELNGRYTRLVEDHLVLKEQSDALHKENDSLKVQTSAAMHMAQAASDELKSYLKSIRSPRG